MTAPAVRALPKPRAGDVIAAFSVALVLIPQSLAYAELAGLPAIYGLYAAALPPVFAAMFASSPYLQTGPVAMTSLLTFGALSTMATVRTPEYIGLAALLALLVGLIRLVIGLFRGGFLAYFMSHPVLKGFIAAAAILIAASQLPTALGSPAPDGNLLWRAGWAVLHPGSWDVPSVVLAVVTIVLILGGRRLNPIFPGVLIAVAVGVAYSLLAGYSGPTIGDVPAGLLPFSLAFPWERFSSLLIPAVVIALVGFAEPAAIARTFATQERLRWSPDREFISQGAANLASAVSGGFPVGGSFSRSSLTHLAGGKTRWTGALTGLLVLAFLPFSAALSPLPSAVLGGIVIAAVAGLIQLGPLVRIARSSQPQGLVAVGTFGLTLVLAPRIDLAMLIGIVAGVVIHLWRELRVEVETTFEDRTLLIRPKGVLFFGSAPMLDDVLVDQLAGHPDAEKLVLDLAQLGRIDYTGALGLQQLAEQAKAAGLEVRLTELPPHALRIINKVWDGRWPGWEDARSD